MFEAVALNEKNGLFCFLLNETVNFDANKSGRMIDVDVVVVVVKLKAFMPFRQAC